MAKHGLSLDDIGDAAGVIDNLVGSDDQTIASLAASLSAHLEEAPGLLAKLHPNGIPPSQFDQGGHDYLDLDYDKVAGNPFGGLLVAGGMKPDKPDKPEGEVGEEEEEEEDVEADQQAEQQEGEAEEEGEGEAGEAGDHDGEGDDEMLGGDFGEQA